jgi:hypothetical protein
MLDPIIIEAKREYAQKVVSNAKSILINANKSVTGGLVSSIGYTINSQGKIVYSYDEAGKYVRQGRRKGSRFPPSAPILKWIKDRGLKGRDKKGRYISDKSLTFLIQRGISKNGIPPFDFLTMAIRKTADQIKNIKKAAAKALKKRLIPTK